MSRKRFTGVRLVDGITDEERRIAALEKEGLKVAPRPQDWTPPKSSPSHSPVDGYRLIEPQFFFSSLLSAMVCRFCGESRLLVHDVPESRSGLSSKFRVYCKTCEKETLVFDTSRNNASENGGRSFDVNRRAAVGALIMHKSTSDCQILRCFQHAATFAA